MATNKAIVEVLFKDKEVVTYEDIVELQNKFREDLWHYQFHALEPREDGRLSTENFLKTGLVSLSGHHVEKFRR